MKTHSKKIFTSVRVMGFTYRQDIHTEEAFYAVGDGSLTMTEWGLVGGMLQE